MLLLGKPFTVVKVVKLVPSNFTKPPINPIHILPVLSCSKQLTALLGKTGVAILFQNVQVPLYLANAAAVLISPLLYPIHLLPELSIKMQLSLVGEVPEGRLAE
jgi:hypothetical protein